MSPRQSGLGRGLDALFSDNLSENSASNIELRITEVEPNTAQPRKEFDDDALQELSASIAQHGVLQPILVRPLAGGNYQIVAGERRWRASRLAGLEYIPVVVKELNDRQVCEIALIENLQREDLNPIEEAEGYKALIDEYGMTQEETAKSVNKSRPAVTNALRLLTLPNELLWLVRDKKITAGHARALLAFDDVSQRKKAVELAENGASVREIEKLAKKNVAAKTPQKAQTATLYGEIELSLSQQFKRKVEVSKGKKSGSLVLEFYDDEDLMELVKQITNHD